MLYYLFEYLEKEFQIPGASLFTLIYFSVSLLALTYFGRFLNYLTYFNLLLPNLT